MKLRIEYFSAGAFCHRIFGCRSQLGKFSEQLAIPSRPASAAVPDSIESRFPVSIVTDQPHFREFRFVFALIVVDLWGDYRMHDSPNSALHCTV